MKKLTYPFLVLLALTACKKEKTVTVVDTRIGTGAIVQNESVVTNSGSTARMSLFTNQDSTTVYGLMNNNSLSVNGFVFYAYQSYDALDQNNRMGFYQLASAKQVRNGLPVFFQDITFGFENGKLNGPPPAPQFIAGNIALDNKPNLSLQAVRDAFIKADEAREATSI